MKPVVCVVSGTLKHKTLLQEVTWRGGGGEAGPWPLAPLTTWLLLFCAEYLNARGRNTAVLTNWVQMLRVGGGHGAAAVNKAPPACSQWSGLHTHCNLAWVIDGGHAGSLPISTSRGEKWKQVICTNLNNSVSQKGEKWGGGPEERIKETLLHLMTAGPPVVSHKG